MTAEDVSGQDGDKTARIKQNELCKPAIFGNCTFVGLVSVRNTDQPSTNCWQCGMWSLTTALVMTQLLYSCNKFRFMTSAAHFISL